MITKYPIAMVIPMPHHRSPMDREAGPVAAFQMVRLRSGGPEEGKRTG
jgi:hypothetical protein